MELKSKKTIIILASVLSVVIATIVAIVLIIRSNDKKPEVATQTEIVTVTDDNGDTVTDEEGEAVTEVVTVAEAKTEDTSSVGGTTAHSTTATPATGATTEHSATQHPTTEAPSTQAPSTQAPMTHTPTTQQPTTQTPTTQQPTTQTPTTQQPTTQAPTTQVPTTQQPTTQAPTTTQQPTTQAPGPCSHTWVDDYIEHVNAKTPTYITEYHTVCNQCGAIIDGHATEHMNIEAGCVSYTNNAGINVQTGYICAEFDWVKTQRCSECGETKDVSGQYIRYNFREWREPL